MFDWVALKKEEKNGVGSFDCVVRPDFDKCAELFFIAGKSV